MSDEYPSVPVVMWDNELRHPLDASGHVLNPETFCGEGPVRGPILARVMTSPYGTLEYSIGDEHDFICFDFSWLRQHRIILHSVINSETGAFIQDFDYEVYTYDEALIAAEEMVGNARGWCIENSVDILTDDGERFITSVKSYIERQKKSRRSILNPKGESNT